MSVTGKAYGSIRRDTARTYSAGADIELPPMPIAALVNVPLEEGAPRFYPEIVAAFEALGFERIGGLLLTNPVFDGLAPLGVSARP